MKAFKELMEKVEKPTGDLKKACWKGYTAVGMKEKNGRKVPNCVPEEVELQEIDRSAQQPGKDGWSSTDDSAHRPNITANKNLTHKEVVKSATKIANRIAKQIVKKKKVNEEVELDEAKNPYSLYSDHEDFAKAHADIHAGVMNAKKDGGKSLKDAVKKHKKVGATDTKSISRIHGALKKHYGTSHANYYTNMIEEVELDEATFSDSKLRNFPGGNRDNSRHNHRPWTPEEKKKRWDDYAKATRERKENKANEEVELDEMQGDDYNEGGWNHEPYDYSKGKWSKAKKTLKNKEWQKVSKKIANRLADKIIDRKKARKVNEEAKLSPKAGKNVVPPTAAALTGGGIVKEEEGENKPLGKVMRAGDGKKKFKVYVKNSKGNTVKVGFGDPNMEIKRDDPERRKNFRARHNCDTATDRTTPRYWSCRNWRAGAKVEA